MKDVGGDSARSGGERRKSKTNTDIYFHGIVRLRLFAVIIRIIVMANIENFSGKPLSTNTTNWNNNNFV